MNEIARIIREHRYVWRKPFVGPEFLMCYCGWRSDGVPRPTRSSSTPCVAEVLEKVR